MHTVFMNISNFIRQSDQRDARPEAGERKGGRVNPTILLERAFLQWNLIDSIANAVLGWIIICTYLFWMDPTAQAFSISGVIFILTGLVCFADIFGVLLYYTNYLIMFYQKKRNPPFPDLRTLKKMGWIANIIWFGIMFAVSKVSFDLMFSFVRSLVNQ